MKYREQMLESPLKTLMIYEENIHPNDSKQRESIKDMKDIRREYYRMTPNRDKEFTETLELL